uniref:Putative sugar porter n=1 Tax=[Candida] hispaniensis TaxID=312227 RepID=A0A1N6MC23_9ASCO|nr:putative sugar porter [[Candida] hispaniensis]
MTAKLQTIFWVAAVVCLGTLQFGYHISELNAPLDILSCSTNPPSPDCIIMSPQQIGLVTAGLSFGGMIAASYAGLAADKWGRKKLTLLSTFFFIVGPLFMANASEIGALLLGRILSGIGSGIAIVVTPLYLSEVAPRHLRGLLGSLCQTSVNIGIVLAQLMGFIFSGLVQWRYVLIVGTFLGIASLITAPSIEESPKWLVARGRSTEALTILERFRDGDRQEAEEDIDNWRVELRNVMIQSDSLLNPVVANSELLGQTNSPSLLDFLTLRTYRKPLIAILIIMCGQQFCGINAIMFYGISVLRQSFPRYSTAINISISVLNVIITIIAAPLIDKRGRKVLLKESVLGMTVGSALVATGMVGGWPLLTAFSTALFVASFAIGLGPIPFLMISEMVEPHCVGVAQSVGMTANWLSTFLVGFLFPTVHHFLGGFTFYMFTATGSLFLYLLERHVPETKDRSSFTQTWESLLT